MTLLLSYNTVLCPNRKSFINFSPRRVFGNGYVNLYHLTVKVAAGCHGLATFWGIFMYSSSSEIQCRWSFYYLRGLLPFGISQLSDETAQLNSN